MKTTITQNEARAIHAQCVAGERDTDYIAVLNETGKAMLHDFLDLNGLDLSYLPEWELEASEQHTFDEDMFLEAFSETKRRTVTLEITCNEFTYMVSK